MAERAARETLLLSEVEKVRLHSAEPTRQQLLLAAISEYQRRMHAGRVERTLGITLIWSGTAATFVRAALLLPGGFGTGVICQRRPFQ
jgi:hypothetical protein